MQLPPGWSPVIAERADQLERELHRELPASHLLHGQRVHAVACRDADPDDVLFQAAEQASVFWVHLTWSIERDPQWPYTIAYGGIEEFLTRADEEVED